MSVRRTDTSRLTITGAKSQDPAQLGDDFETLLTRLKPLIEDGLAAIWERQRQLSERYGPEVAAMIEAARDLTLRGGKRYRAALLVATYMGAAPKSPIEPAIDAGVAIELLQTYLLIQDDWIDGDSMRRGGPTVHMMLSNKLGTALGPASAILASDLTWGLSVGVLANMALTPLRVVQAIQVFSQVHSDVVIGQQLDVIGRAEDVEAMHALKTGSYTVRGPMMLGAVMGGMPDPALIVLERFAAPMGVAFQLRDDLLGTFASPEQTGKPVGNDLRAGKRTAIVAEADRLLDDAGRKALDGALGKRDASDEAVATATRALEECGAKAAIERRLDRLCEEAEAFAHKLPLTPQARKILAGAATTLRVTPK